MKQKKNMFNAACFQFSRSVGKKTLHPAPSIDEKGNLKPFQLVVKTTKRRFIFFEKASFHPSEFQITDVLSDDSLFSSKPVSSTLVSDYNRTCKISLKGHFGADICKEILDLELKGGDSIELDIKFGKVMKLEVPESGFMSELNKRYINMDHPFIRQVREDKNKSLCLITGVATLQDGGSLHRITEIDATVDLKANVLKSGEVEGETTFDKDKDIVLTANTPVAYNIHELNVDRKTGALQLVLTEGRSGGFRDCIGYDEVDATSVDTDGVGAGLGNRQKLDEDLQYTSQVFAPLFALPEKLRGEVTKDFLHLLTLPRDLNLLDTIVELTERGQQNKIRVSDLDKLLISEESVWGHLLTTVGFLIKDGDIQQPMSDPPLLQCLGAFLDAASLLSDEELLLLSKCSRGLFTPLVKVIQEGIKGKNMLDPSLTTPILKDESATKLLLELKFRIHESEIQAPVELVKSCDGVYWILHALWGRS